MNKKFHMTLIILATLSIVALFLAGTLYISLTANSRLVNAESSLIRDTEKLFSKMTLENSLDPDYFLLLDSSLRSKVKGFKGYKLTASNNAVLYATPIVKNIDSKDWKKCKQKAENRAIARRKVAKLSLNFTHPLLPYQFTVYIDLVDNEVIKSGVLIIFAGLSPILLLFIIILLGISFRRQKEEGDQYRNDESSDSIDDLKEDDGSRQFILSLHCLQKFDSFIEEAKSRFLPFSLSVLRITHDIFDEENHEEPFNLLEAHIKFNNGYYEYNNNQMIFLIPDTDLKESIKLLEEFTARIIEDNIDVNLHCGVTSMNGRDVTSAVMIREAEIALDKAVNDSENMVVGFNPDPDRYKEFKKKISQ